MCHRSAAGRSKRCLFLYRPIVHMCLQVSHKLVEAHYGLTSTALEVSCSSSLVINENDFCKLNERYLDDKLSDLISFPYLGYFFSAGLRTSMRIWPANQNRFLFRWKAVLKTIYQRAKRGDKTISISIFHSLVLKSMTFKWAVRKTRCCPNIINIDRASVPHGV